MNKRELTNYEELLIELVHYLAYGDRKDMGLTLKEVKHYLTKPIKSKGGKNKRKTGKGN